MEVYIQQNRKLMEIWVPTQDQFDQRVQEQIKNLYHKGKKADLSVAVFFSGNEELQDLTSALLTCNQEKAAADQVKKDGLQQV